MKKMMLGLFTILLICGLCACDAGNSKTEDPQTQTQTPDQTQTPKPPHTHAWGEPTVAENGDKVYTCSGCKETKTEKHAHAYANEWTCDAANHWHVCTAMGCGEKIDVAEHQWGDPVTTKEPTSDVAGEKEYACTICGKIKKDSIECLPAKMSEMDWAAAFAFENVKVQCDYTMDSEESSIIYLIDSDAVQITMDGVSIAGDRTAIESFDFSSFYDVFNHYGNGVYRADRVIDEEMLLDYKDVTIQFSEDKIKSISYIVDMAMFGELVYEYTFSEWGSVSVTAPELTAESLAAAFDASNFENYTVYINELIPEEEYYVTCMLFDGDQYYISMIDANGDVTETDGTLENAGTVMMPQLAALADSLDASKFVYDGELMSFAYTEEIENFMESDLTVTELYLQIEDDVLISCDLIYDDGSEVSYYFEDYDITEIFS